jgi:hypothetical protein
LRSTQKTPFSVGFQQKTRQISPKTAILTRFSTIFIHFPAFFGCGDSFSTPPKTLHFPRHGNSRVPSQSPACRTHGKREVYSARREPSEPKRA